MKRPFLSIIAPTIGRVTLEALLQSIRAQTSAPEVEVICVGDTYGGDFARALTTIPALCAQYDARYVGYSGPGHAWGHYQRDYGMALARGTWLWLLQDDDTVAAGAYQAIRTALWDAPRVPHLFQVDTWQKGIVWTDPELRLANVDADGILTPNLPTKLACWEPIYNGDWSFIRDTVALYGGRCVWVPHVIAHGRPAGVPADLRRQVYA